MLNLLSVFELNIMISKREDLAELSHRNSVPFVVWCFWYQGEMNDNRKRSLEMMKLNLGVPVILITEENINEFVLSEHPLHPTFHWLSDVHKSDYMRIYLLHHYGGGWHDIKPTNVSFQSSWDWFADPHVYFVGRAEVKGGPAKVSDHEGRWMPDYWSDLVGCGWWIGRKNTPLSSEMYQSINRMLDNNYDALKKYPAKTPFDKRKIKRWHNWLPFRFISRKGYPLPWTVFGNIFHPLNYKYRMNIKNTLPSDQVYNSGLPYR
jgi:hypothetical protein